MEVQTLLRRYLEVGDAGKVDFFCLGLKTGPVPPVALADAVCNQPGVYHLVYQRVLQFPGGTQPQQRLAQSKYAATASLRVANTCTPATDRHSQC